MSALWEPVVGPETEALLARSVPSQARDAILESALAVLGQCTAPTAQQPSRTGLIVGYVQSGKTLSFTTVAALANDNDFRMVIMIAGTTRNLSQQSVERLINDLGVNESSFSRWTHIHNPDETSAARMRDVLAEWDDPNVDPADRRVLLLTVLKHHQRLESLLSSLRLLGDGASSPTLVIDDEADQASLNNRVRVGELSTTYGHIRDLRDALPHHSYLQYTATPQALLLINLIDILSPEFTTVLEPGVGYVGGAQLFGGDSQHVHTIPTNQIPTPTSPLNEPPESLKEALRLFIVGVASGIIRRGREAANRSMLIHPSRETVGHGQYFTWVQAIRTHWMEVLDLPMEDEDRIFLIAEFERSHRDISQTESGLEPFCDIEPRLLQSLRRTDVRLVNSQRQADRDIQWRQNYSWILVGGQVLDRGFTVEGLTVTYMPRGPGVGNADTIQQRARFLGYKGEYLGFCRVFLDAAVAHAYRVYVEHEEDIRAQLQLVETSGKPLTSLRRTFLCDRQLRPTRRTVLDIDFTRPALPHGWCIPHAPHWSPDAIAENRGVVEAFLSSAHIDFRDDDGHGDRTEYQRHKVVDAVQLQQVYDDLLTRLRYPDFEDGQRWVGTLIVIDRLLHEDPQATCALYKMRPSVASMRTLNDKGRIEQLMQGAHQSRREVYPGDRRIHSDPVTIQIHELDLTESGSSTPAWAGVIVTPIWLSRSARRDLISQPQGG
ncbi:MAG: hypothetical protein DHS20C15_33500 [Planctomycetota bacterium]|nr:MAG: hypothetical protein DHS20C15_33500 [Planctomycetota bacterium]